MSAGPTPQRDGIKISITVKNGSDEFTLAEYISPLEILHCASEAEFRDKLKAVADRMFTDILENHYEDN